MFTDGQAASASGTFYGSANNPRIVRINDMPVEAVPVGVLFMMRNKDRPGIVGWIGSIMGKHGVNIASMSLGRDKAGGQQHDRGDSRNFDRGHTDSMFSV